MEAKEIQKSFSEKAISNVDPNVKSILADMLNYVTGTQTISGGSPYAKDVLITFQSIFDTKKKYKASEVDKDTWLRIKNRMQDAINKSNKTLESLNQKLFDKEVEVRNLSKDLEVTNDEVGNKFLDLGYEIENLKAGIKVVKNDIAMLRKGLADVVSRSSNKAKDILLSKAILTIINSTLDDKEALDGFLSDYNIYLEEAKKSKLELWQVMINDVMKERTSETIKDNMIKTIETMLLILGTHIELLGRNDEIMKNFPKIEWDKETPIERYGDFNKYWGILIKDLETYLNNPANVIDIKDRDSIVNIITFGKKIILDDLFKDMAFRDKIFVPTIKSLTAVNYKRILPSIKSMTRNVDKLTEDERVFLVIYVMALLTDPGYFPVVLLHI